MKCKGGPPGVLQRKPSTHTGSGVSIYVNQNAISATKLAWWQCMPQNLIETLFLQPMHYSFTFL